MTIVEKYPHLKEAYTKLQELSLDEDAISEYNLRLRAFYDETTMLNEMERRKIALEEMQTKIDAYQIEFENTAQKLEKTNTELEKTKDELENALETGAVNNALLTAKKALQKGIDTDTIAEITGLAQEQIKKL